MAKAKKKEATAESLDVVIKSIGKGLDKAFVGSAREILSKHQGVVPSSLRSLNRILGKGGFRLGRVAEFYGEPGAGKTALALDLIKNCQMLGGRAAFIDAEQACDLDLLENMGIDTDELVFVQGFSGEENLDIAEKILKTGEIDVIVIDSVTALIPEEELAAAMGDNKIALHARLMSRAVRRLSPICAKTGALGVFINQIRFKVDGYGDPRVTTGGNALKFFSSYRIQVTGGSKSSLLFKPSSSIPYGQTVKIDVQKNKLAAPYRVCEADIVFGKGFDGLADAVNTAVNCGLIEKKGSWYSKNDVNIGQGIDKVCAYFESNPEEFASFLTELDDNLGIPEPPYLGDDDVEAGGEG